jgi:parallel beta-helix repeat protein
MNVSDLSSPIPVEVNQTLEDLSTDTYLNFTFTLTTKMRVTISMDPSRNADYDLYAFNFSGNFPGQGIAESLSEVLLAGTYYFHVQYFSGTGTFDLTLTGYIMLPVHNVDTGLYYETIQEAIDAPETHDGHTIFARNGIYYESLTMNKSISIVGESTQLTIIDGNMTGVVVHIELVDHFMINNITIRNGGSIGIEVFGIWGYFIIDSCCIMNNSEGIRLLYCGNGTILGSTIKDNTVGLVFSDSSNNNIFGNNVLANNVGIQIGAQISPPEVENSNNTFYHNNFVDNTDNALDYGSNNSWDFGYPFGGNYWSDYTQRYPNAEEIDESGIWNTPYLIEKSSQDHFPLLAPYGFPVHNLNTSLTYLSIQEAIDAPETRNGHTIFVETGIYCENVVISKSLCLIGENKDTVVVDGQYHSDTVVNVTASGVLVTNFTIQRGTGGYPYACLYFHPSSSDNVITHNDIRLFGGYAILLDRSQNNTLADNCVSNNGFGIRVYESADNIFSRNTISKSYDGVRITGANSSNNIFLGNNVSDTVIGFLIYHLCSNNAFIENDIWNNDQGINIEADGNRFLRNNFIKNDYNAYVENGSDFWDNDAEGNYWDDYVGVDLNHDGIGNNIYVIDANNIDRCPLMGPSHRFRTSAGYDVEIISNSTVNDFEYFEANSTIRMHVANMTKDQPFGFCRVCIPHTLMNPDEIAVIIDEGQTPVLYHNYTLYDNGTHRWIYFAYDHSIHEVMIQDSTPPTVSILSPENKTYNFNDVPLTFTLNEPTSWIGYSLDGATNVTITENTTLTTLTDGTHYVVVYANDTAGNTGSSDVIYFTIDTTPPNITNVTQIPPKDNVLPEDEVEVNATVTDALNEVKKVTLVYAYANSSGTWIRVVDMTNPTGNIWNATVPAFPYCTNVTYTIIAEDSAGNTITTQEMGYEYQYHVIPEYLSLIALSLFAIATLLAAIVYKRKRSTYQISPMPKK